MWKFAITAILYSTQFPPKQEFFNTTWVNNKSTCDKMVAKNTKNTEYEKLGVKYRLEVRASCENDPVDAWTAAKIEAEQQRVQPDMMVSEKTVEGPVAAPVAAEKVPAPAPVARAAPVAPAAEPPAAVEAAAPPVPAPAPQKPAARQTPPSTPRTQEANRPTQTPRAPVIRGYPVEEERVERTERASRLPPLPIRPRVYPQEEYDSYPDRWERRQPRYYQGGGLYQDLFGR